MRLLTERFWRILSNTIVYPALVGGLTIFVISFGLIFYYSVARPHVPQPDRGWTAPLPWTNPISYGTAEERAHQLLLHSLAGPLVIVAGIGVAIRKLKVERKPRIFGHHTEGS